MPNDSTLYLGTKLEHKLLDTKCAFSEMKSRPGAVVEMMQDKHWLKDGTVYKLQCAPVYTHFTDMREQREIYIYTYIVMLGNKKCTPIGKMTRI